MLDITLTPFILLILVGLSFIAIELFVGVEMGFDLVLLGSILIIGGITGNITQDLLLALSLSSVLSVLYILFGRRLVRSKLKVMTQKTNIDNLIGKTGIVIDKITPHKAGKVKLIDETWRASSQHTIDENEKVIINGVEGVTLQVEKS